MDAQEELAHVLHVNQMTMDALYIDGLERNCCRNRLRLCGVKSAFIGTKDIRKNVTIQTAFVFITDGVNRIGFVLMRKDGEMG